MLSSNPLYIIALTLLATSSTASSLARPALQQKRNFQPRDAYQGGWPLALTGSNSPSCPSAVSAACNSTSLTPACCPTGQTCVVNDDIGAQYCCPTGADCKTAVLDFPVCANSTWDMFYANSGHYFCCMPGQIASQDITLWGGLCEPANQAIPTSLLATLVSQVGAPTAAPSVIAGGSTNTTTTPGTPLETNPTTSPPPSSSGITGSVQGIINDGFSHTGVIAGSVVGFVFLVLLIGFCARRRHRSTTVHMVPVTQQWGAYQHPNTSY